MLGRFVTSNQKSLDSIETMYIYCHHLKCISQQYFASYLSGMHRPSIPSSNHKCSFLEHLYTILHSDRYCWVNIHLYLSDNLAQSIHTNIDSCNVLLYLCKFHHFGRGWTSNIHLGLFGNVLHSSRLSTDSCNFQDC